METKPCPFCGCSSVSVVEGTSFRWRVARCNNCGAQAGEVRIQTFGEGTPEEREKDAKQDAFAEWNTRHTPNNYHDVSEFYAEITQHLPNTSQKPDDTGEGE
jgi:Lar family restriction alleviation protein